MLRLARLSTPIVICLFLVGCSGLNLGGGGSDICFSRGGFSLIYADLSGALKQACTEKKLSAETCTNILNADSKIRDAIANEQSNTQNTQALMQFLGQALSIAGKGAL